MIFKIAIDNEMKTLFSFSFLLNMFGFLVWYEYIYPAKKETHHLDIRK